VVWPSISYDGKWIVFERDLAIWRVEASSGKGGEVAIALRGAPASPTVSRQPVAGQFTSLAISPDGKKLALVGRGEVFAAQVKEAGEAERVTRTSARESSPVWAPDSKRLAYISDRNGPHQIFLYDFSSRTETQLTSAGASDADPRFSPDGKLLAFLRGGTELRVLDLEKKQEALLATGIFGLQPLTDERSLAWSPDNQWIAYLSEGGKGFTNVHVVKAAGGPASPASFLANSFASSVAWSPDGTFLLFATTQRTEPGQIARLDLILRTPKFREDQFRDLFKPSSAGQAAPEKPAPAPAPAAKPAKPTAIVFEEIRRRLQFLPTGLDARDVTISPDGKAALITAEAAGQVNLYTYSLDELAREQPVARQLTSTPGFKSEACYSPDGKEVLYLESGRLQIMNAETRQPRALAVTAEMEIDFEQEKREVFRQAWSYQRDHFFDAKFNGVDWEAMRKLYEPHAGSARTPGELYRTINLMLGELNASHMGISAPPASLTQPFTGRLGLRFDAAEYETAGRLRIIEVIPLGPAAVAGDIKPADYLLAVDGVAVGPQVNLDQLLEYKIGKRVELTVSSAADGSAKRIVAVRPVNLTTEKNLLYRKWVETRRAYVERVSGGRLGYVHIPDMGEGSLRQLYVDLDAGNHLREGVVIDIRNNSGGFVNAYALDVFTRRPYLTMSERDRPAHPARSLLGQRALELPTILVTNQHSLSDAEDFTEGYRRLKLGKVVGEPTAGWIVYTWSRRLIDGSILRMPRTKVFDGDGQLMEMHPRPVDVPVDRPVGETFTDRDSQLDAAVKELLAQIGERARTTEN
jgi:C-terminal processing protease CtpA/Prc/Tol biopolymer transport system component